MKSKALRPYESCKALRPYILFREERFNLQCHFLGRFLQSSCVNRSRPLRTCGNVIN